MRTTLDLPASLLDEALKASGLKTKTQTIIVALTELVQRRKSRDILALKGSWRRSDYDPKRTRRKVRPA